MTRPGGAPRPIGSDAGLTPVGYNLDLEIGLIGSLLLHGPEALAAADGLTADDFSPVNSHIWHAATTIAGRRAHPDLGLIVNELGPALLQAVGGHSDLAVTLIDALAVAPPLAGVPERADALRRLARTRAIQATALDLAHHAHNGTAEALLDRLNELRTPNRGRISLTSAATIDAARPHWIWDQRIPVGGVTLMAGREGHGKTLLVCWLAARLTRGRLPGEHRGHARDVVYVGLEDDRSTVIKPRLVAAGADVDRFHFVDLAADETFALDTHLAELGHALEHLDVGLIVIDPLDAHLGHVDSHKKGEVQAAIGHLATLTQTLRCGALGLAHFNKNAGLNDLLTRIAGSTGFSTAVRSVLAIGPHPDDDNDRLCLLAKANMTSKTDVPAIRFRIEPVTLDHRDETIATATVALIGEEDGHLPDRLLIPPDPDRRTMLEEAIEWLYALLEHRPQPKADIERLAKVEGITPKTLRTARERLGVIVERDTRIQGRPSTWSLRATARPP